MAGIFVATLISTISMSLVVVVPSSLTFACSHFPYCAGQSRYLCSSKNSSSVKNAFPVTMDGSFYDYECRFNWSMKVECRLGIYINRTDLSTVVNCVDLRLDLRQPRRVHDGQGLEPELWTWKGELDLRRNDLHRDLSVLLKTLPNLMAIAP